MSLNCIECSKCGRKIQFIKNYIKKKKKKLDKKGPILVPRFNLNLYLGTGAPGHARLRSNVGSCKDILRHSFKLLMSINYQTSKVYKCQILASIE